MFHKFYFVLFLFASITSLAQVELLTLRNEAKTSSSKVKEIIPLVNTKNASISVFIFDSKNAYGKLLDQDLKTTKSLNHPFKIGKYEQVLGYSFDANNDARLFMSNEKATDFSTVHLSFSNDTIISKTLELDLKNESFLEALSIENEFYLLTLAEKAAVLHIYHFDDNAAFKKHSLDFSAELFLNKKNKPVVLNELLENIVKIEANSINSIDISSEPVKLYIDQKQLLFSLDQHVDTTQLLLVDLNTFEKRLRRLPKPLNRINKKEKISNSYINKEQLFTIAATKDQFSFTIQDLKNGAIIKNYDFTQQDSITFKNSNIIQIGAVYDNYRELEKTKKFLQKINYGALGVSVNPVENELQVLLGGQHEYRATTGGMGMMRATKNVQLVSGTLLNKHFSTSQHSFNKYSDTKSTYIKTMLDENFEHLKGELKPNVFDKIISFEENKLKSENLKSLFKYKDGFLILTYLSDTDQIRLRKY